MVESVDIREMNKDVRVWSLIGGGVARSGHSEINKNYDEIMMSCYNLPLFWKMIIRIGDQDSPVLEVG